VSAKPGINRRVLLAAGGLTLLAGCSTSARTAAQAVIPSAGTPSGTRSATPSASARSAVPRLAGTRKPGTSRASTRPSASHRPGHDAATATDQPVYYIDDGPKTIALTIDDGPSPVYTPQILRLLAKYHVTASFSMIGISVDEYPAIARDVAAAGHVIMNHTWQHLDLPALRAAAALSQMDRATEAIHRVTGRVPTYFRAPYGAWSGTVLQHCEKTHMTPVDWSVDPRDWARPGVSHIYNNILSNTRTGSIILEHDGGGDRSQTVAALSLVIPRLLDAGYHFRAL
jgi:peptidoglycan/xylan/chitin deacetylase (PgdA/CDA1 family)